VRLSLAVWRLTEPDPTAGLRRDQGGFLRMPVADIRQN